MRFAANRLRQSLRRGRCARAGVRLEALESRCVLTAPSWPGLFDPVWETEPNDTVDCSQSLGLLSEVRPGEVVGRIDSGRADVDYFHFILDRPSAVSLRTLNRQAGSLLVSELSLYNHDPFDFLDPFNLTDHRLLVQADGAASNGDAVIQWSLAAGSYYVAVTGSGNHYFHPFLADSGMAGSAGTYGLQIEVEDLEITASDGPQLIASDPRAGARLDRSPLVIRANFSGALEAGSIVLNEHANVRLRFSTDSSFSGADTLVPIAGWNLSTAQDELQLFPAAPLRPGFYRLELDGDTRGNNDALRGLNGIPIGQDADHRDGQVYRITFRVTGVEDGDRADDIPNSAHDFGDIGAAGLVQAVGAIGDDPTDEVPFNPADVDLYRFELTGAGRFELDAEVWSRRIGSPLNPGVSLFRLNPTTRRLEWIASNDNTENPIAASNGSSAPLFSDAALYVGLTEGTYFIAVSNGSNLPDPEHGLPPGTGGVFDPHESHSGEAQGRVGTYVLNVHALRDNTPPTVIAVEPSNGAVLSAAPTSLAIQFSEAVNLRQLALRAFVNTAAETSRSVFIESLSGQRFFPRLVSYDEASNTATFLMLDALANGRYELHVSGALGLTDFAGNPLTGSSPDADFVTTFEVSGRNRGTEGDPLWWHDEEPNDSTAQAQTIGVLFPHELQTNVRITGTIPRTAGQLIPDGGDFYRFEVLQRQHYFFVLTGASGVQPFLRDVAGNLLPVARRDDGIGFVVFLQPGVYVLEVNWVNGLFGVGSYRVTVAIGGAGENPSPLTSGPVSPLRLRLHVASSPPAVVPAPVPTPVVEVTPRPNPQPPVRLVSLETATSLPIPAGALSALAARPIGGIRSDDAASVPATTTELRLTNVNPIQLAGLVDTIILSAPKPPEGSAAPKPDRNAETTGAGWRESPLLTVASRTVELVSRPLRDIAVTILDLLFSMNAAPEAESRNDEELPQAAEAEASTYPTTVRVDVERTGLDAVSATYPGGWLSTAALIGCAVGVHYMPTRRPALSAKLISSKTQTSTTEPN